MKVSQFYTTKELSKMGTGETITYEEIQRFLEEILTNLRAIPSTYGNGKMGHTHLFYTTAEYNKLSVDDNGVVMPYIAQPYPGPTQVQPPTEGRPSLWTLLTKAFREP